MPRFDPQRPRESRGAPRRASVGGRIRRLLGVPAVLTLLLWAAVALSALLAWRAGLYRGGSVRDLVLIGQTAVANAALLMLLLDLRERAHLRRDTIARREETLRYLRTWVDEEGLARKTGLLRDLNAMGAVPRDLDQIALPGVDLSGVDLRGARLHEADLRGANLRGARLDGAQLWGADLTGADLSQASLAGTSLRGCNLRDAVLTKADLAGANLHRADLVNANVQGVRLEAAHLAHARFADGAGDRLHSAIHPSVEDWVRARLDEKGRYAGEDPPTAMREPEEKA